MFGVNWRALERRIGLRRDATRAPIRGPEWQGRLRCRSRPKLNPKPRRKQSLLKARNGLDNGVHFRLPIRINASRRAGSTNSSMVVLTLRAPYLGSCLLTE